MKYSLLFIAILFLSCSSNIKTGPVRIVDLPDSDFAYKNLSNSLVKKKFYGDNATNLYRDSTKVFKLYSLDSTQRKRIIAPIIGKDSLYVGEYMSSYVVAKQNKIGSLTPIIFEVDGDDYSALIYALLDKKDKPISSFLLEGGPCGGPDVETDTLMVSCPYKNSFIKGNKIFSYVLRFSTKTPNDSIATIDSTSYETIINRNGTIKTNRTDSARYKCAINLKTEF